MDAANAEGGEVLTKEASPLLRLAKVTRRFPGVLALDAVDFELRAGEVHVLFGENGAGKSTLINLVAGALQPSEGTIFFRGNPIHLHSVHHARSLGISAVFQEFSLVPHLTVEQNVFLGAEVTTGGLLNKKASQERAEHILNRLGFPLKPAQIVAYLSRAEQQMVEIAKAFRSDLSVLILDEPTASLTERETDRLFELIEQVKRQGVGVIYITHRMSEIRSIGDRITVLRDGRYIDTVDAKTTAEDELVRLMTGHVFEKLFPVIDYSPRDALLSVDGLTTQDRTVVDVSIEVRAGEVVGLAGLVGSGKSEVGRACFGLESIARGRVYFQGEEVTGKRPRDMLDRGLFYLPPDRRSEGLVAMRSVRENISLPSLSLDEFSNAIFLKRAAEVKRAKELVRRLNIRPPHIERDVDRFSGGNQQKVMLAKALTRKVKLFIFDEPTVGVDVGTRVSIYEFIRDLCEAGAGVLLISSDLPEILHLTNRTYVMYHGILHGELRGEDITQNALLSLFFESAVA